MEEKAFKSMGLVGASSIAIGIVVIGIGIGAGVIGIIGGTSLLKNRKELTF